MISAILLAATLLTMDKGGINLKVESETKTIDPGRSVFLTVTLRHRADKDVAPPDLRARARGFSLAEDYAEEPVVGKDGFVTDVINWKLIPEPCAKEYKIAPFVVGEFWAGPIYFENPAPREAVTGAIECDPQKDLPPFSWRLVGFIAGALAAAAAIVAALFFLLRFIARRVKEHRMSPIERAWVELDRLIKKGLPGRGKYKDFYVELTMVVRRYIQRKYGIRAPHLTTEEFLREIQSDARAKHSATLAQFLESADMVKFAGVEATPEMADAATDCARGYLKDDDGAAKVPRSGDAANGGAANGGAAKAPRSETAGGKEARQ